MGFGNAWRHRDTHCMSTTLGGESDLLFLARAGGRATREENTSHCARRFITKTHQTSPPRSALQCGNYTSYFDGKRVPYQLTEVTLNYTQLRTITTTANYGTDTKPTFTQCLFFEAKSSTCTTPLLCFAALEAV
jgi:hypothetical protein